MDRLLGRELETVEFLSSVRDASSITYSPFPDRLSKYTVAASLDFQLSYDLFIEAQKRDQNLIDSVALAGGVYIILCTIVSFIFSAFVPYFMHLYIIRKLFKVDNNPRKKPQSQAKMGEKNHGTLVQEAKDSHKYRVRLTTSGCDRCMLVFESVIRVLTCGMNRWSRTVNEGVKQIKGELDIFNYMRRLRMTQATVNALTTFNQRRLLEAQVETSFLLQPLKKQDGSDDEGGRGKKLSRKLSRSGSRVDETSSDEESEEDFAFLDQELKDKSELDEISQRLLAGIIQAPPVTKKRFDKMTREEIWERRR